MLNKIKFLSCVRKWDALVQWQLLCLFNTGRGAFAISAPSAHCQWRSFFRLGKYCPPSKHRLWYCSCSRTTFLLLKTVGLWVMIEANERQKRGDAAVSGNRWLCLSTDSGILNNSLRTHEYCAYRWRFLEKACFRLLKRQIDTIFKVLWAVAVISKIWR